MSNDEALTPPSPAYRKVLRIRAALATIPVLTAGLIGDAVSDGARGAVFVPLAVLALAYVVLVPSRRFRALGYAVDRGRLRIVRGLLISTDTIVPFGRVQHVDLDQGPLERRYDLATLTVHTAGTHNASVALPGLEHAQAIAMREKIGALIRRESA